MNTQGKRANGIEEFVCAVHPDRWAVVNCYGVLKCGECWLPRAKFVRRFGAGWYDSPDSPGRIAGRKRRTVGEGQRTKKVKVKRQKGKDLATEDTEVTEKGLFG